MADVEPLLRQVLAESGIAVPSREQAARHLVRHYLQQVASREVAAREGLWRLVEVDARSRTIGIFAFVQAYYAYEDLDERSAAVEAVRAHDEDVVRLAKDWLGQHGA